MAAGYRPPSGQSEHETLFYVPGWNEMTNCFGLWICLFVCTSTQKRLTLPVTFAVHKTQGSYLVHVFLGLSISRRPQRWPPCGPDHGPVTPYDPTGGQVFHRVLQMHLFRIWLLLFFLALAGWWMIEIFVHWW